LLIGPRLGGRANRHTATVTLRRHRIRALLLLVGLVAVALVVVLVLAGASHHHPRGSTVPFAASGPWRAPLPADAPLTPQSPPIVANLVSQVRHPYGVALLNTDRYSSPIYTVPAGQARVNVEWTNCVNAGGLPRAFATAAAGVPIPAGATPSIGTDAEMVIWQPSTDTEWEFWRASNIAGHWSACGAGRIQDVRHNPGIFSTGGVTGSALPLLGFLIRVADLRSGAIEHAVNIALPCVRAGAFSWPAHRTDGHCAVAGAPAEGQRFRFPASLDLSRLGLSRGELMIARAMQRYGAIVTDYASRPVIQAEDPRQYETAGKPGPYATYFRGSQADWLQGFPWQDLKAVAWNYGQPGA
jgi:hypothetical protein